MKRLGTRVNLIPVIAKADTLTQTDLAAFKRRVSLFPIPFYAYVCSLRYAVPCPCLDSRSYCRPGHPYLPATY